MFQLSIDLIKYEIDQRTQQYLDEAETSRQLREIGETAHRRLGARFLHRLGQWLVQTGEYLQAYEIRTASTLNKS